MPAKYIPLLHILPNTQTHTCIRYEWIHAQCTHAHVHNQRNVQIISFPHISPYGQKPHIRIRHLNPTTTQYGASASIYSFHIYVRVQSFDCHIWSICEQVLLLHCIHVDIAVVIRSRQLFDIINQRIRCVGVSWILYDSQYILAYW